MQVLPSEVSLCLDHIVVHKLLQFLLHEQACWI